MSSGGGASKTTKHRRTKPMVVPQHARSAALLSPSNPFASEEEDHPPMLKVSLSSISKLEVRSLKRRLTAELDEVRSLIAQFDPQGGNFTTGSMGKGGNKKLKTGNGVKRGDKGTVQIFKKCLNLLTKLMKHKDGWVFNVPVDAKGFGLHDYHTIVKEPMDLGTVKAKLGEGLYESPLEFAEDVRLTFNNAILYNPVGHEVHSMAKFLLSMFEEKWAPIEEAPVDIRDLTMDEKRRLSEELQDLPYDKLETVVQIVKKSNPELSQQDDEIELDIDSLDIQTLWELYSFVTGYKESLSNKKEEDQGFGSERDAESAHNIIQEPATGTERSRVTESGKAIRMSSSPVRQENKAGGSSSSNSSSSDSGSSSSDSDSDSSSGRGSDTGN
ncbi:BnaC05g13760D [Brassica napus]|uniref:BnaC05g13760D protein n=1 Tax=Brassica napus TaxID=3708 RepID=A0A078FXQ1_BRANA|nr:BnaC05g13760D [Brassica napus]